MRRELGLRFEGEGGLSLDFMGGRMLATYFRAPGLQRRLRHPHVAQPATVQPTPGSGPGLGSGQAGSRQPVAAPTPAKTHP